MLWRFFAKRVAVLAAAVALCLFLLWPAAGPLLPFGVLLGAFVAVYKIRLSSIFLLAAAASEGAGAKGTLVQLLSQMMAFALLLLAALLDTHLFFGVAAGLLLVPAVICINAVTEKLGLTHNRWGEPSQEMHE